MRSLSIFFLLLTMTATARADVGKDVDITAADGTRIKGTYWAAAKPGPGVVLLHMCNSQRKAWSNLGSQLAARGIHALAIDYRGYGESGGTPFDKLTQIERQKSAESWPGDVDKAFDFLAAQRGVDRSRIGASGGSCGVNQAVQLARRHPEVKTMVLLAGGTNAAGEAYLTGSSWLPIFGVAARDDGNAVEQMQWLLGFSSNPGNQLKIYEQGGHGTNLFPVHKELEPAIVTWFEQHLITRPVQASPSPPKPGPSARASAGLREPGGGARALAQVREARKSGKTIPLPPEGPINAMGYEALQGGRVDDAIGLFELNVELHPESANTYDSLGDAYLAAGKKDRAAELARKTLDMIARDTAMPEEAKKALRDSAEGKLAPAKP